MYAWTLRRIFAFAFVALWAFTASAQSARQEMLLYCGITMVRPMTEIAQLFEKREGIHVAIAQGGSEDLFQAAKKSSVGDWYLPGEPSFRDKHQAEGLFGDPVLVGHNQMALMVRKGNPKQVKADPNELLRKDLVIILGNAESGSVGQESKSLLDRLNLYPRVIRAAAFLAPDSRSLVNAMKKGEADLTLNWRATAFFPDNVAALDVIDLEPNIAKPQALLLIPLKSSRFPDLTRRFMALAASEEGQAIFRKFGFLDSKGASNK